MHCSNGLGDFAQARKMCPSIAITKRMIGNHMEPLLQQLAQLIQFISGCFFSRHFFEQWFQRGGRMIASASSISLRKIINYFMPNFTILNIFQG